MSALKGEFPDRKHEITSNPRNKQETGEYTEQEKACLQGLAADLCPVDPRAPEPMWQ